MTKNTANIFRSDDRQAYGQQKPANAEYGSDHYPTVLHNAIQAHVISLRPQRCCYRAFAAHMPACLLNELHFLDSYSVKKTVSPMVYFS